VQQAIERTCHPQVVRLHDMPDGYEVSIRTPVTPPRWEDFNEVRAPACKPAVPALRLHLCTRHFTTGHTLNCPILPFSSNAT
jgi:hypothetical protein